MRRLVLVRHAPTEAVRRSAFPIDEPVEQRARPQIRAMAAALPAGASELITSGALRARQTAEFAGLTGLGGAPPEVDPRVAESGFGDWAGSTLEEIYAADPAAATSWMTDPSFAPPGGESLEQVVARVGGWLDEQAQLDGNATVVTHGGVVRAALIHALGAPLLSFWRFDVAPLSITELHAHSGRWTITRVNVVAAAAQEAAASTSGPA
jgi:broad specificity phosphatase PhoE